MEDLAHCQPHLAKGFLFLVTILIIVGGRSSISSRMNWFRSSFVWYFFYHNLNQGWAGMTFKGSGTGTGKENSVPKVREQEGNWKSPFPKFGNGKGIKKSIPKFREREGNEKKSILKIREQERNEKKAFLKFGNGKGMKKTFPKFGNGNQSLLFPGMDETGNGNGTKWLKMLWKVLKIRIIRKCNAMQSS